MAQLANLLSKDKKRLVAIFLILAQIVVIFGYILPILEETEYYSSKIIKMENEYKALTKKTLYANHHKQIYAPIEVELDRLKKTWSRQTDYRNLQKQLGILQKENHLTVISQKITPLSTIDMFDQQVVRLVLSGKYTNLIHYFDAILEESTPVIFSHLSLTNQDPTSKDPTIRSEFELRYFDTLP